MKKIDLGQAITILANVGVIAGIVFLAVELQQNNEMLGAQARALRTQTRIDAQSLTINNPELRAAYLKEDNGEPLTQEEQDILSRAAMTVFTRWEYIYGEYERGLIDESAIPIGNWKRAVNSSPTMIEVWQSTASYSFGPGFVQWMEQNVLSDG